MSKSIWMTVLAGAALAALWSFHTSAQVIDGSPCEQACYEQKAACVAECGRHANPVECEADCRDALRDCTDRC